MHLEDERIQRILHGELAGPADPTLSRHLEECHACRLLLEEARREEERIFRLLGTIDRPAPRVDLAALTARAARRSAGWGRWAAGVLLALGAVGVAYAAPGSPFPGWVSRVGEWITGPSAAPTTAGPPAPGDPVTAGIAVTPGERFSIRFRAAQAVGRITVSVAEGPNIVLRAVNGVVTFTTDVDRLTVANEGATADYEVELPRAAPWVEIQVGERRLILKQGSRLVTDATADSGGRYVVPVGP